MSSNISSNNNFNNNNNFNDQGTKRFNRVSKLEQDLKNLQRRMHSPKVDLVERGDFYLARIELPGVELDSINIQLKDSQIVLVSGQKSINNSYEADRVVYRESRYDSFTRRVKLPGKVKVNNFDKSSLNFANGVLNLSFEKDTTIQENDAAKAASTTQNWADM